MSSTSDFWSPSHISSVFGAPRDGGKRKHRGCDWSHGRGVPIPSPLSGVVTGKLAPAPTHGFGYQVTIRSDAGPVYSFAHMNGPSPLAVGARVSFGQTIGYEGTTGATTGPCVHVEYYNGGYSDPAPHIAALIASSGGSGGGSVKLMRITVPGVSVLNVQDRLLAHGISIGPWGADGRNGTATSAGLETFQRNNSLVPDRVVGTQTWAKLSAASTPAPAPAPTVPAAVGNLSKGSRGPAVKALQEKLARTYPAYQTKHGKLVPDSIFGSITEAWVKEFQTRSGLYPDGVVGPDTRAKLGI